MRSSVLVWPDARTVVASAREWAARALRSADVVRAGYFGSYARGDAGVGSDLDLLLIVRSSDAPFERRAVEWETTSLPVPADLLVYTVGEWEKLTATNGFHRQLASEVVWVEDA